jgi:hypothetical protein
MPPSGVPFPSAWRMGRESVDASPPGHSSFAEYCPQADILSMTTFSGVMPFQFLLAAAPARIYPG